MTKTQRKAPDSLAGEGRWDSRRIELLPRNDEVVNWRYERGSDAKKNEIRRKADALEALALNAQRVKLLFPELIDHLEQQLIWEVKERDRYPLLLE